MSFDHNKLVTHGIATVRQDRNSAEKAVLFNLQEFKATGDDDSVKGVPLFLLSDIHPEALNLLMASVHMYQMIVRNSLGLEHIRKEIVKAAAAHAIGPIFAKEVQGWIEEIQKLNRVTRTLVLQGQEASDKQLTNGKHVP